MELTDTFHDELVAPDTPDLHERFFDRFVFNLHPTDATAPSILFGYGIYPPKDTVDGFVILVTETEQRNVRYSTELSATDGSSAGPFSFQVVEPMKTWHVAVGPNPTGLEFDLTWRARAPAWFGEVGVKEGDQVTAAFDHLFQSGYYDGTLSIDGETQQIEAPVGKRLLGEHRDAGAVVDARAKLADVAAGRAFHPRVLEDLARERSVRRQDEDRFLAEHAFGVARVTFHDSEDLFLERAM